jgi:outer membrane cobalamin receptor
MGETIFAVVVSALALNVNAQNDTLTRQVHELEGVEVVSAKAGRNITSAAPLQLISSEKMELLGVQTMAEALNHMAGIAVRDYGGAGGMKTVSVRGIGSRHTSVIYDGMALSDCQTGEIDLSRYSLDNVRNLQLVIGDGDNIFVPARTNAAAAYLAIENMLPPTQNHRPHVKGRLTYGAWNTVAPSFYYGRSITDRVALSVQGEFLHSDNDYPFRLYNVRLVTREHRTNSMMNAGHAEGNVNWQINRHATLSGKLYYYDSNRELPGIVHLYTHANDETLHERNAFGQLGFRTKLGEQWWLMLNAKLNWAQSNYHNGTPGSSLIDAEYNQSEFYTSAALMYSPCPWLALDYSADYFLNRLNSSQSYYSKPSRHSLLQSAAAKVHTGRFTLTGRLLWSNYLEHVEMGAAGSNAHRLSPSVSASYRLLTGEELYLRAFWKSIFRMPTFNELYYYHIGPATLKPEKTSQWNVGLTYRKVLQAVSFEATADVYINKVEDKIIVIPFNMFVWRMMNLAKVGTHGMDLTANVRWTAAPKHTLEWTGNYSWQRAENQTNRQSANYGNQIAYTPEHSCSATTTWLNPWLNMSCTIYALSRRWTTNEHAAGTRMAGYGEMHVSAYRTFAVGATKLTARASLLNVTNKQYDIVAHYPMPGRSWRVSLTIEL